MNSTTQKITVGVAIAVFAALIIGGVRLCRAMEKAIIKLEERAKK